MADRYRRCRCFVGRDEESSPGTTLGPRRRRTIFYDPTRGFDQTFTVCPFRTNNSRPYLSSKTIAVYVVRNDYERRRSVRPNERVGNGFSIFIYFFNRSVVGKLRAHGRNVRETRAGAYSRPDHATATVGTIGRVTGIRFIRT